MSYKKQKLEFTPDFFGGVCFAHLFSLFVFSYYVSVRSQFRVVMSVTTVTSKTMFGSSLPPVIYVICVCLRIVVSNTYCVATFVLFLLFFVFVLCLV